MSVNGELIEMAVPYWLDLTKWKFIIKIMAQQSLKGESLTTEKISNICAIAPTILSSNMKFLRTLNIITPDSKGSQIILTEDGIEFGQSLIDQNPVRENEILTKLLKSRLKTIVDFCDAQKQLNSLNFDRLFEQIKFFAEIKNVPNQARNTDRNYAKGIYDVIEMLVETKIVDESLHPSKNEVTFVKNPDNTVDRTQAHVPTTCQQDWLTKFFTALEKTTLQKLEMSFIIGNVVGNAHESSVMRIAKFLEICDKEGNLLENYEKLRYYSTNEFKTNLTEIIKQKYSKSIKDIDLTNTTKTNLASVFMREYALGKDKAERAVNVFTQLCRIAEINLSEDIFEKPKSEQKLSPKSTNKHIVKPIQVTDDLRKKTQSEIIAMNNGFIINIRINIDAKDPESFKNSLNFIRELKKDTNTSELDVQIPQENINSTS